MDGLLNYKGYEQQQKDDMLRDMFQRYSEINSPNYWYDEETRGDKSVPKDPNFTKSEYYYVDPSGRGIYKDSTFSSPNHLYPFGRQTDYDYDSPPEYLRNNGKVIFEHRQSPAIDSMAFPEWFAKEQLENRNRNFGQYTDAVNFALDLESHKRDPYEVEAYNREQQSRKGYEGKRRNIHE